MYQWNLGLMWEYRRAFINGLSVTLQLTFISIFLGTGLGFVLGVILSMKGKLAKPLKGLVFLYIAIFGWLPLLVLLIVLYYFLPALFDLRISAFSVSWIALSLNLAAFVADVVRGGIQEIPSSYIEAGKALGMSKPIILYRIVIPEIIRRTLPAHVALYINQFKWTTLCSVIGVQELLHQADTIMIRTYRALEAYLAITIIYLVLIGIGNAFYFWLLKLEFFHYKG